VFPVKYEIHFLRSTTCLVTEERYSALFYMPLYKFLHNLLNELVQIANKIELQKENYKDLVLKEVL
jgi:hypothetical protein